MTPSLFNAYLYGVVVGAILTLLLVALITVLTRAAHRRWKARERRKYYVAPRGMGSMRSSP